MARRPELEAFCAHHGLLLISIADLIRYRRRTEKLIQRAGKSQLQTAWGVIDCIVFESIGGRHLAMIRGDVAAVAARLVRVHIEYVTGDIFGSGNCECGRTLVPGTSPNPTSTARTCASRSWSRASTAT